MNLKDSSAVISIIRDRNEYTSLTRLQKALSDSVDIPVFLPQVYLIACDRIYDVNVIIGILSTLRMF